MFSLSSKSFRRLAVIVFIGLTASLTTSVVAQDLLVADLNEIEVAITTDFNGADLLLFGTIDHELNDDVIIIVEGPPKNIAIRQKSRVSGIWINTESATLDTIPSFYQISSTRPLNVIASTKTLKELGLGLDNIPFDLIEGSSISGDDPQVWKAALIRNMENEGLWNENSDIKVRKKILFRSNIHLPANILPGEYHVRILHFRSGQLFNETYSLINVQKKGLSAQIYQFAHNYPPAYGMFAIIFAVFMGWGAARVFRR